MALDRDATGILAAPNAAAAETAERKSLPWWRLRTWRKDFEALVLLRNGLRALDGDDDDRVDAEPPVTEQGGGSAPGGSADSAVAGRTDLKSAGRDPACRPYARLPRLPQVPAPRAAAGRDALPPGTVQSATGPSGTAPPAAAPLVAAPTMVAPAATGPAITGPAVTGPAAQAAPDPGIAAIRATFNRVAKAGDEAAAYFYARLFLRNRDCGPCSRLPWTNSGTGCSGLWPGSWRT